jgi:hypothetical protein
MERISHNLSRDECVQARTLANEDWNYRTIGQTSGSPYNDFPCSPTVPGNKWIHKTPRTRKTTCNYGCTRSFFKNTSFARTVYNIKNPNMVYTPDNQLQVHCRPQLIAKLEWNLLQITCIGIMTTGVVSYLQMSPDFVWTTMADVWGCSDIAMSVTLNQGGLYFKIDTALAQCNIRQLIRFGGGSVMVWGGISLTPTTGLACKSLVPE